MKYLKKFSEHSDYLNLLPNDLPNISYCEQEDELHYNLYTSPNKTNFINLYFTTVALESGTINFTLFSWADTTYVESFAYSKNDGEWVETQNSDNRQEDIVISVNVVEGDKVRWKGIAEHFGSSEEGDNGGVFTSTCRFNAQGNTMSLLYGDEFANKTTLKSGSEFFYLFYDINNGDMCKITDASRLILPAATLTEYCYYQMFYGCTNLTTAPVLPATTLASYCYNGMFGNCTNLTTAPELPATTLTPACYCSMFRYCTNLTTAPELPATTLANECYNQMFSDCINLTVAPDLPATTLATTCYYCMFQHCTSLTTAPILPATTLVQSCYQEMFIACTSLNSVICLATDISANYCTSGWLYNVAPNGTFVKADGVNWTTGTSGIPTGWNVYTEDDLKIVKHYELDESELAVSAALNDLNSRVSLTEITWAELKELRDNSNLVPGKWYRITDYITTTMQTNTQSAGHQFDILVMATGKTTLCETALAVQHEGDEYFADSKLEAWELRYTLENVQWSAAKGATVWDEDNFPLTLAGTVTIDGTEYMLWKAGQELYNESSVEWFVSEDAEVGTELDEYNPETGEIVEDGWVSAITKALISDEDGTGTILWMKDEFGNECPYDFKNIQFKRWKVTDGMSGRQGLNGLYLGVYGHLPYNISISDDTDYVFVYTFTTSSDDVKDNSLGGDVFSNKVLSTRDGGLPDNVFYGNADSNHLGYDCRFNTFLERCYKNVLGSTIESNIFGKEFDFNTVGNNFVGNSLGGYCSHNVFGCRVMQNNISGGFSYNSVGNDFIQNEWANVQYALIGNYVTKTKISTASVRCVQILNGTGGPGSLLTLGFAANKSYTQVACLDSNEHLVIYVPGDLS